MRAMTKKIGQKVTLTLRNSSAARFGPLGHTEPEYVKLTGVVLDPSHKGCYKEKNLDIFFLSVPHTEVPLRVIDITRVVAVDGIPVQQTKMPANTWKVPGSRGTTYTVTRSSSGRYSCGCTGFSFRHFCSHIESIK